MNDIWIIEIEGRTGVFKIRPQKPNETEQQIDDQILEAHKSVPLWLTYTSQDGSKVADIPYKGTISEDSCLPLLRLPSEDHARAIADSLQSKLEDWSLPWTLREVKVFQLFLRCIAEAAKS